MDLVINKNYNKCKKLKSLSEFCKDKSRKDGHHSDCKDCRRGES